MVDIDAYIGNHTVFFGMVCAYNILRQNLILNDLEKDVVALDLAIGKNRGHGRLVMSENDGVHQLFVKMIKGTSTS